MFRILRLVTVSFSIVVTGCATSSNPQDPLEPINRKVFTFNDTVDRIAVRPVAETYQKVVPQPVQASVGNFFGNINDVPTGINNLLQARYADSASDVARVFVNTTVGVAGIFDVASSWGLAKHDQDFGQTLGRWGTPSGPYVVLPLLGSTTMRDALAMALDFEMDPWGRIYPIPLRNIGAAIRIVDYRAYNLNASSLIEDAALDKYEFVRDAYLQRRKGKIYDDHNDDDAPSQRIN